MVHSIPNHISYLWGRFWESDISNKSWPSLGANALPSLTQNEVFCSSWEIRLKRQELGRGNSWACSHTGQSDWVRECENKISRELQLLVYVPTEHRSKRGGGENMKSETQYYLTWKISNRWYSCIICSIQIWGRKPEVIVTPCILVVESKKGEGFVSNYFKFVITTHLQLGSVVILCQYVYSSWSSITSILQMLQHYLPVCL